MKIIQTLLLTFFFIHILFADDSISSGLTFHSHELIKEQRTSLLLNDGKEIDLPDGFTLEFYIKFRTEEHNYGYVFRIIGDETVCFDLISNFRAENRFLNFIEGNRIFIPFESIQHHQEGEWGRFRLSVDLKTETLTASFNEEEVRIPCAYEKMSSFRFQFGYCDYEGFVSYDVPPVTVRDIRLWNAKGKPVAYWPLMQHNGTEVYDVVSSRPAKAFNPVWEIDKHTHWTKQRQFASSLYTQVTYNEQENILYFANKEYVILYDPVRNRVDSIGNKSGSPYYVSSNQLKYNPYTNALLSYDFTDKASGYDFENHTWSGNTAHIRTPFSHHNAFISPVDSGLYIFGGYGEYTYSNTLLKLNETGMAFEEMDYDKSIPPRYLGAVGFKGKDTLLVLGGYGHISGKQELGPSNYYDLYGINLRDFSVKKYWEKDDIEEHFVLSNEMVVDTVRNKVYALTFPNDRTNNYLLLRSFDMDTGESVVLADSIPYFFEDINSFCSLYHSRQQNKLYAVTLWNQHNQSVVSVYSLDFPPLAFAQTRQYKEESFSIPAWWLVFITGILLIGIIGVHIYKKKQPRKITRNPEIKVRVEEAQEQEKTNFHFPKKSAILFLNGFQVWDRNGEDITRQFTPTLRYLLVLIILYTRKNGKGVANNVLRETLWNDKSADKAQNNRRVNIQKLKNLLANLDGVALENANPYWSFKYEEPFFSDYLSVFEMIRRVKESPEVHLPELRKLLQLLSSGQPLPYLHQSWADPFISEYGAMVQDFLWEITKKQHVKDDPKLLISIADIIFSFDLIDENALCLKCEALYKSGKSGLAKATYDAFCAEYKNLLDVEYSKGFKEICPASR